MLTYKLMMQSIQDGKRFAFSRWGDGEWSCLLGSGGGNCDGHEYFDSLGKRLREVLRTNPKYFLGMQPKALSMDVLREKIVMWCGENEVTLNDERWCNADMLHDASIAMELMPFVIFVNQKERLW
jgi:hypothetical protein